MKINSIELIDDLKERVKIGSAIVSFFCVLEESELQYKSSPMTWSVLECIAHLNRYYAFYIPLLNEVIANNEEQKGVIVFKTGILGQYFVKLMEPQKNKKNRKLKAIADMNPNGCELKVEELSMFISYQLEFLAILEKCKNYNLSKHQIPTVMSKWITISLGDTFRFIVAHTERHLLQTHDCLNSDVVLAQLSK